MMTEPADTPLPPAADPQDPLPEASFFWRRWLTWFIAANLMALLWGALVKLPPGQVLAFAQGVMILLSLSWFFYFGGASAADIGNLVAHVQLRLGGLLPVLKPAEPKEAGQ